MSDGELAEFEALVDAGDDDGATRWLKQKRQDYRRSSRHRSRRS